MYEKNGISYFISENIQKFYILLKEYIKRTNKKYDDEVILKTGFYYFYRIKQKLLGGLWGLSEGYLAGAFIGGKLGGGGGFIIGGISQLAGFIVVPMFSSLFMGLMGLLTDKPSVVQYIKDFRYKFGAGMSPPIHKTL